MVWCRSCSPRRALNYGRLFSAPRNLHWQGDPDRQQLWGKPTSRLLFFRKLLGFSSPATSSTMPFHRDSQSIPDTPPPPVICTRKSRILLNTQDTLKWLVHAFYRHISLCPHPTLGKKKLPSHEKGRHPPFRDKGRFLWKH